MAVDTYGPLIQPPVSQQPISASQFGLPARAAIQDLDVRMQAQEAGQSVMFYRTATQDALSNSTTFVNDNVFVVPMVANATYIFDGWFLYSSTVATSLFKVAWTLPAGASGFWTPNCYPTSVVANPGTVDKQLRGLATPISMGLAATNSTSFEPMGNFICGATAGNAQFQFAQNVATVATTQVKSGAWLRVTRIS